MEYLKRAVQRFAACHSLCCLLLGLNSTHLPSPKATSAATVGITTLMKGVVERGQLVRRMYMTGEQVLFEPAPGGPGSGTQSP
jgi:hypothetical protein